MPVYDNIIKFFAATDVTSLSDSISSGTEVLEADHNLGLVSVMLGLFGNVLA
jgi:hypothetical protein